MSGAQSWSVKGIDPKVREAVREAAAKQGMTLGEYLSQALQQGHQNPSAGATPPVPAPTRSPVRSSRLAAHLTEEEEDDWRVSGPTPMPKGADAQRLAQRIDSIERRTQLAVTGLDRAVSTIDRSVLGLAARVEDAEAAARESTDRVADALEHFRSAGDLLGGRLEQAERDVAHSRRALDDAAAGLSDFNVAKERLEEQASAAEEVARRAEAAANFLATELESRDASISHKLGTVEDQARQALSDARATAEEAARQASIASSDAVTELRRLQENFAERLSETETSTRRAVETAIERTRSETQEVRDTLSDISGRVAAATELRSEHAALISRIERAEAGARESTAGLRQAAGAAIADLRNAQLTLAARVKQVEEAGGGGAPVQELRQQQTDIAERLAALEAKTRESPVENALAAFEKRIDAISNKVESNANNPQLERVDGAVRTLDEALNRLAQRLQETESTANNAIRTLEETVSSLGARVEANTGVQETEALRAMLETRLDSMAQSVSQMVGEARDEIGAQVHAALEGVQSEGLEEALADVNRRLAAAERRQAQTIEAISIEIKRMSETVDKRLRAVEARNDDAAASAVREELSRMSSTLEHRFDEIERREAAAFDRMGLEVGRLSERLEDRVGAVEGRSAQAIEQVGEQVARMAERFNQRHELLARELGERMIDSEERSGARVSDAISSIMQRLNEVEQSSHEAMAPVQNALSSVATRLDQFQNREQEPQPSVPTPSRRVTDFDDFGDVVEDDGPFAEIEDTFVSPMDAAQPVRAAPITPTPVQSDDIYFSDDIDLEAVEDDDLLAELDPPVSAAALAFALQPAPSVEPPSAPELDIVFAPPPEDTLARAEASALDDIDLDDFADDVIAPPPQDDDPFWTPDSLVTATGPKPDVASLAETPMDLSSEHASPAAALFEDEIVAPAPTKNDYLANARKAAQAQSQAKGQPKGAPRGKTNAEMAATPTYSLRGSSRIVLWGAASAIAMLIAGGAWYVNSQREASAPAEPVEPAAPPPNHALAPPPSENFDPNQPFGAPVEDPAVQGEGGAVAPTEPASATPPVVATTQGATTRQVAGPLPARNVSLEQAAQGGDIVAQYELALQRLSAGRSADGVSLLRRSADRGLAMAQYRLAKLYERGEGVPADLTMARQWTERAAAAGNRRAMHDLGVYFARGEGAPLDEAAAFRWFRQAAELGVADSQYNLGVLYQQGRGVGASPSEAMFWFLVAARQGDEDAAARSATLEATLPSIQVEQARARAAAFRPRASSAIANGEFGPRAWNAPRA